VVQVGSGVDDGCVSATQVGVPDGTGPPSEVVERSAAGGGFAERDESCWSVAAQFRGLRRELQSLDRSRSGALENWRGGLRAVPVDIPVTEET